MNQHVETYKTAAISETENGTIKFFYKTIPGRLILQLLIRTTISKIAGFVLRSPASCVFIDKFITKNNIDMEQFRKVEYRSFDEFFVREIKKEQRPFPENENDLASPCDSKLTAYRITADQVFNIKHSVYSISDLLHDPKLAAEYTEGVCLIFRLTPDDYHRYCFIDDGEIINQKQIKGVLHTVQPIACQQSSVFCRNSREYTVIRSKNFDKIVQMEVGALFVGRITNHSKNRTIKRAEEKGMFQFGGSTIIMLFKKDTVEIDEKIYENTNQNKETIVKMGNKIGKKATI